MCNFLIGFDFLNYVARAAGKFFKDICIFLMKSFNYMARAAGNFLKMYACFLIGFLHEMARAAGKFFTDVSLFHHCSYTISV